MCVFSYTHTRPTRMHVHIEQASFPVGFAVFLYTLLELYKLLYLLLLLVCHLHTFGSVDVL